jgi:hypothetical protein
MLCGKLTFLAFLVPLCCSGCTGADEDPPRRSVDDARPIPGVDSAQGYTTTENSGGCLAAGGTQLTGASVGTVRLRESEADIRIRCTVAADTVLLLEGEPQPALLLALGIDTVMAEIVSGRIWRLRVRSPGLRTSDSTGVGTPANRLLSETAATLSWGEGEHYVISPSYCGLSFQLQGLPSRGRPWTSAEVAQMPDRCGLVRF